MLRLHRGRPIIGRARSTCPTDTAIPAAEVPATAHFTAPFVDDKKLLQRERKKDIPGWLWTTAVLVVLALYVAFLTALAWGVARVARRDPRAGGPGEARREPARGPVVAPPPRR